MASRIPKSKLDVLAINVDIGNVVLKDGGDVDLEMEEQKVRPISGILVDAVMPEIGHVIRNRSQIGAHLREGALGENTRNHSPLVQRR